MKRAYKTKQENIIKLQKAKEIIKIKNLRNGR